MKIKSLYEIPAVAAYLKRIGAEPRSLRAAVVRENKGAYWEDIAVISIESTGIVKAPANYAPTEKEKLAIEVDCQSVQWPQMKMLKTNKNHTKTKTQNKKKKQNEETNEDE